MSRKNICAFFLLFSTTTLFFFFSSTPDVFSASVESVIAGHNTCEQCHGRYSDKEEFKENDKDRPAKENDKDRPARIPENRVDLLCMGCHGLVGISSLKANIHGKQNYVSTKTIGCLSCHDPHDNNPNYLDGENIKLIGDDKWDKRQNYAQIKTTTSGNKDVVFESRGIDASEPSLHSFADGDEDNNNIFDGICEVCHTQTAYHRNDGTGEPDHYTGQTCTNCHVHVNQFLAFTEDSEDSGGTLEISGTVLDASGSAWANITLFLDINGNGVYDPGEPTTTTDENGNFTFKGLENKGYDVLIMPGSIPDWYEVTVTTKDDVVTITTTAKRSSVEGYVWSDTNLSGEFDEGDAGFPGVTVFLDMNSNKSYDAEEPTVTTDSLGFYSFSKLAHEPYWIHIDETLIPEEYQHITNNNPFYVDLDRKQKKNLTVNFGYRNRFQLINPENTRLKYPTRLSWSPNGGYYVTDSKVDAIFIHDSTGNLTGQLRGLNKPLGVISDAQGRIYVGSNGRNNVEIYSAGGVLLQVIGDGNLKMPNDLVFDREQNLYVLDSQNKMVKVFNPDGLFVRRIGNAGGGDGQFTFPVAIAINYRTVDEVEVGELFVADKKSSRIQVFDLEGNYLRSFGGPVEEESGGGMMGWFGGGGTTWNSEGKFVGVQSLAFDQNGKLHALDSFQDNVQILDPVTGAYISHYDAFLEDTGAHLQLDIDISPDGKVIMTNVATRSVEFIYTVQ